MGSATRILRPGDRAPEFRLRNLAGGHTRLAELLAKSPVVLAFFKISCPVCQLTLPFLERIHQDGSGAISLCGISQDEADWTRDFNRRFGITFPSLLDTDQNRYQASDAFGISTVPTMFLVERDGTIGWVQEGFNRREVLAVAGKAGVNPFRSGEYVPEWKAG
jgi:peroxiredoxin